MTTIETIGLVIMSMLASFVIVGTALALFAGWLSASIEPPPYRDPIKEKDNP